MIAYLCEKQAKINASSGVHKAGTPTPASHGSGPAVVTGTLRRSITTFGPNRIPGGYEASVAPTVDYARPVEVTLDYPFMKPAAEWARRLSHDIFAASWEKALKKR